MKALKTKVALATTAVFMATSQGAWAQAITPSTGSGSPANIGALADTVAGSFASLVRFGMGGAFMVGVFFVIMGIMRLKAAADSQGQQVKYSEGLWRLGVAAALCGIPAVVTMIGGTAGISSGGGDQILNSLSTLSGVGGTGGTGSN